MRWVVAALGALAGGAIGYAGTFLVSGGGMCGFSGPFGDGGNLVVYLLSLPGTFTGFPFSWVGIHYPVNAVVGGALLWGSIPLVAWGLPIRRSKAKPL